MTRDDIHTCSYSCERPACIKAQRDELAQRLFELVAEAVAAEREACAKVCDEKYEAVPKNDPYAEADGDYSDLIYAGAAQDCAEAIRARGET